VRAREGHDSLVSIPEHGVRGSGVRTLNEVLFFNCESELLDHMLQLLPTQLTASLSEFTRGGEGERSILGGDLTSMD
jgi:hypothetical protein